MKTPQSPGTDEVLPLIETEAQASAYLDGLINRERSPSYSYARMDLRAVEALLAGLGNPERGLSVIHIAGSKGKGSTALFTEAILCALGESVGTFTSPHLVSWTERFRIDGAPVDEMRLARAVTAVRPVVERLRVGPAETVPSFFDATTAVAFLLFADAGVDRAVIEVGLGGRLDSTNAVAPAVTCITGIELEHTDKLGETEAEIAFEKAGILKPGVPAVFGPLRQAAEATIHARAAFVGAPFVCLGREFQIDSISGGAANSFQLSSRDGFETRLSLSALGDAARINASLATFCVRALSVCSDETLAKAAGRGLPQCRLPGRIEVLRRDPLVVVDAAHTQDSATALSHALETLSVAPFELLLSVSADKRLEAVLQPLLAGARRVWVTQADPIRSLAPDALSEKVEEILRAMGRPVEVQIVADPDEAAEQAFASLAPDGVLVATGSVYLAGRVRTVLEPEAASVSHEESP